MPATSPGPTALLAAAAGVAVCGYLVYFGAALMAEALYIVGLLWALDCGLRLLAPAQAARSLWPWAELDLAIALTAVLRQVFLPVAPVLPGLAGWAWWRQGLGGLGQAALLTGLIVLWLILPIAAYNYQRFGLPVRLNTNAGFTFYWASHPIDGDQFAGILPADGPTYGSLIPTELRSTSVSNRGLIA